MYSHADMKALSLEVGLPLIAIRRLFAAYGDEVQDNVYSETEDLLRVVDFLEATTSGCNRPYHDQLRGKIATWAKEETPAKRLPLTDVEMSDIYYAIEEY